MKCLVVLSLIVCYCHGFGLLGGYTHHGVDKEVTKAANFAFKSLPSEELSAESGQLTMTRVSDVETQVVSGINYKMKLLLTGANGEHKTCDVVVWSKPWMNFNHLTKYQCTDLQQAERLGAPVTGAPIDWHTNDKDVQKILELALVRINGMMNSMYSVKPLDKVEHVTKQTVAGWKYTFDVTVGETVCTKSEVTAGANLDSCAMKAENSMTPARFHVEGLYQDWMDPPYRLLDVSPI